MWGLRLVLTMAHGLPHRLAVIITFLGTKGGTGTTTMAVNCATTIHRFAKRRTVMVEVKPGPGDLAMFLGLRPRYSLVDLIDQGGWTEPGGAGRFVTEHESGLHALVAPETHGRPNSADASALERAIGCMATAYPFVVIDAGSTLTPPAVTVLTMSDVVLLVANPDVPCLRNVRRLSDALRVAGVVPERLRIVLNRASEHGVMPVSEIEKVLDRGIDFQVSSDYRTVALALNAGVPIASLRQTGLQQQLDSMARTLIGPGLARTAS
jgi:pilus assembly protein CpaE